MGGRIQNKMRGLVHWLIGMEKRKGVCMVEIDYRVEWCYKGGRRNGITLVSAVCMKTKNK